MHYSRFGVVLIIAFAQLGLACTNQAQTHSSTADTGGEVEFQLDAWADNWFAAYLDETLLVEDSAPITTERSFNAETVRFKAKYPLHLNFILKDFKQDDTGLEYIGTRRQQMGDGGFIMQLTDLSKRNVVAVSGSDWACTVIQRAPLDKNCEQESNPQPGVAPCTFVSQPEPDGWMRPGFDDSAWPRASIHSAQAVTPKGGYTEITWNPQAKLIWGPDLEADNTVLCRITINDPDK